MSEPDDRTPLEQVVEQAVDLFVYAPIGLLFEGSSLLPELVQRGRSQASMARMIGKFAVDQGRTEATKAAGRLQDQAAAVLDLLGGSFNPRPDSASGSTARPTAATGARAAPSQTKATAARSAPRASHGSDGGGVATASLAIPDYDGLSASQVVNRLPGLSGGELESVRRYEAAGRGRKTILSKVAQLQAG